MHLCWIIKAIAIYDAGYRNDIDLEINYVNMEGKDCSSTYMHIVEGTFYNTASHVIWTGPARKTVSEQHKDVHFEMA